MAWKKGTNENQIKNHDQEKSKANPVSIPLRDAHKIGFIFRSIFCISCRFRKDKVGFCLLFFPQG